MGDLRIVVCLLSAAWAALGAAPREIVLRPDLPAGEEWYVPEGNIHLKTPSEKWVRKVMRPVVEVYPAATPNGTGVIIAPGGGFAFLAIGYEGRDVARWMNECGVTAFVLRYRVGLESREASRKAAVEDVLLAMKTLRRRAAEWKLDPERIGVLGFSAGGYLTVAAATAYDPESRPGFAVPIYATVPEYRVRADAPPMFIAIAADDTPERVAGSAALLSAWRQANRPVELHVFADGGHGFGMDKRGKACDAWTTLLAQWMERTGLLPPARPPTSAMDSVLLKDWKPDSSLVVYVTNVAKPRYPAIDVHVHVGMPGTSLQGGDTAESIAGWVKAMDEAGVEKLVALTEATGAEFDRLAELYRGVAPGRFQIWCGLDIRDYEAPDYPQRAAAELERCYRKGARGVGELSDKGFGIMGGMVAAFGGPFKTPRERRLHLDDPRLDLFWTKCAELNMPVNLHVADHPSAWRPPDNRQERLPGSQRFNQYGMGGISYQELMVRRDRLLARHPGTKFIACHLSNQGNDLAELTKAMERFPNLYLEIAARDYEIGREPRSAARFLAKYKDRTMFGTDMTPGTAMYQRWWRLLETADEYMPGPIWWRLYGLRLPDDVLEALYRRTASRVLNWK